jgi:hypothetical protein
MHCIVRSTIEDIYVLIIAKYYILHLFNANLIFYIVF